MTADLSVDLTLLESTAGSLAMLIEEFKQSETIVNGYDDAIGAPVLVHAVDGFASNWKTHREDLLKSMDAVYQMATKSHKAFVDADDKLAQDITQAMTDPKHQQIGQSR